MKLFTKTEVLEMVEKQAEELFNSQHLEPPTMK